MTIADGNPPAADRGSLIAERHPSPSNKSSHERSQTNVHSNPRDLCHLSRTLCNRPLRHERRDPTIKGEQHAPRSTDGAGIVRSFLLIVAVGLLAMMLAGRLLAPVVESTSAPTIEHLQPLASLITTKVHVTDVVTANIVGQTGDLRAAIIVHGDAMISVDLTKARIEQVDLEARTATIVLPPPHVVSARVDHNRSRIFDIQASGLWSFIPTDAGRAELIDQAMRLAQESVRRAASDQAIMEQARTRAASLICTFMAESLDWSVEVKWLGAKK